MPATQQIKRTALITAAVLATGYLIGGFYFQQHLLPNTKILGVNVGRKTVQDADKKLSETIGKQTYTLVDGKKTVSQVTADKLGLKQDFNQALTTVKANQHAWSWPFHLFGGKSAQVNVKMDGAQLADYTTKASKEMNAKRTAPQNASMRFVNGKLQVTAERPGNSIDADKLSQAILNTISQNKKIIDLTTAYAKPSVTTKTPAFVAAKKKLSAAADIKAKLKLAGHTIRIPQTDITGWIGYENGKVTVDAAGVQAYVKTLNDKYATYQRTRQFHSTRRGVVSIGGGTYGWSIKEDDEVKALQAALAKGGDFTREVITQGSGYHKNGADIGKTYVEVDLAAQHEYVYKDGKLLMDTPIVSGKPGGNETPTGVFSVWNKQRNATLRGKNDDGSNYASPVSYWMPIDYTGVGLHDSPWQPQYGGSWYVSHGSHGCVNNPPAFIAKMYDIVAIGTPVIVI